VGKSYNHGEHGDTAEKRNGPIVVRRVAVFAVVNEVRPRFIDCPEMR